MLMQKQLPSHFSHLKGVFRCPKIVSTFFYMCFHYWIYSYFATFPLLKSLSLNQKRLQNSSKSPEISPWIQDSVRVRSIVALSWPWVGCDAPTSRSADKNQGVLGCASELFSTWVIPICSVIHVIAPVNPILWVIISSSMWCCWYT